MDKLRAEIEESSRKIKIFQNFRKAIEENDETTIISLVINNINFLTDEYPLGELNTKRQMHMSYPLLNLACEKNNDRLVQIALEHNPELANQEIHKFKINISQSGQTSFTIKERLNLVHSAAEFGSEDVMKSLLKARANPDAKNSFTEAAIQIAARNGHNEIISQLLANSADVNIMDCLDRTALYYAIGKKHKECAKELIRDKNCDVNIIYKDKKLPTSLTVLHRALINDLDDIAEYIIKQKEVNFAIKHINRSGDELELLDLCINKPKITALVNASKMASSIISKQSAQAVANNHDYQVNQDV